MGVVYKAHDPVIERFVAIKMLSAELEKNPKAIKRFKDEARKLAKSSHKNVTAVYHLLKQGGRYILVMEYLDGNTLHEFMQQEEDLPLRRKLSIAIQICEGLSHVHSLGITHRDIKPENIQILANDEVKIMDFGIARSALSTLTQADSPIGTPPYMSPEQVRGEVVDHRTDIFSFGILFYELLASKHPFVGEDEKVSGVVVMNRIAHEEPARLTIKEVEVQDELQRIIWKCLKKDREERYDNMGKVIDALNQVLNGEKPVTLRERLSEGGVLPWARALSYARPLLVALDEAAGSGVVHGAIKPTNILTAGDTATLINFGQEQASDPNATLQEEDPDSLSYRAPEFFSDRAMVDHRSDLYALGMTLYEMLTGRLPFDVEEDAVPVLVAKIGAGAVPPLDHFPPDLPPEVVSIVMRALKPEPNERYQHASEMLADIETLLKPVIRSLSPNPIRPSNRKQDLIITGTNFQPGARVIVHDHRTRDRLPDAPVQALTSERIVFPHVFDTRRAAWSVQVVNPYSIASDEFILRPRKTNGVWISSSVALMLLLVGSWFMLRPQGQGVPSFGALSVFTTPDSALVFLDSVHIGPTPLADYDLEVESDTLSLHVEKEGYVTVDTTVYRQGTGALTLNLVLDTLPSQLTRVAAGNDGADDAFPVEETSLPVVEPDTPELDSMPSQPGAESGTLVLRAQPPDSVSIVVGGHLRGTGSVSLTLLSGEHTVLCSHPQYGPVQTRVDVVAGQTRSLTCYFEQTVNVVTLPDQGEGLAPWASVVINGDKSSTLTTLSPFTLSPDTFIISVEQFGYTPLTPPETLIVRPAFSDTTYSLRFQLRAQ